MSLRDALADLPEDAMVPVRWIREQLGDEAEENRISDLSVREVADELDRAPSTIRGWLGEGRLDGYRLRGNEWRIPRESLRAFLEEERSNGTDPEKSTDLGSWREVGG